MANRWFEQFVYGLVKGRVQLYARVTFGASGAPTLDATNSKGFKSITRTGAGAYDLVLQDTYQRVLGLKHICVNATAPASPSMYLKTDSVSTAASPKMQVVFNSAGTATDPGNGEEVRLVVTLKNSSV